jgi:hypothetical protein
MPEAVDVLAAGLKRTPTTAAIDTALFQSADSYFSPSSGLRDPFARAAFEEVATPFCNNARLVVPLLNAQRVADPPKLMQWWGTNQETAMGGEWPGAATQLLLQAAFVGYVERHPKPVSKWVSFQFTDELRGQNFTDWEERDLDLVDPTAMAMIHGSRTPKFCDALGEELTTADWVVPQRYRTGGADRLLQTSVAYALSVYVRSWSYAWALSKSGADPVYRCFWLRESALDVGLPFGMQRQPEPRPEWFPWGSLLTSIFGRVADPKRVEDALQSIRERSDRFLLEYRELLQNLQPGKKQRNTQHERDLLIADVLQRAGATPKLKARSHVLKLVGYLRSLLASKAAQKAAGTAGAAMAAAEVVISHVPPDFVDRAAGALELRFRREKYWEFFDNRPLRTVRDWEREITPTR